jgi:hypothetical protein
MEAYKKTITIRIGLMTAFIVIVLIVDVTQMLVDFGTVVSERVWSFSLGLMIGTEMVVAVILGKYLRALRDGNVLKALFIAETDERNVMIRTKTGGMTVNIIMGTLALFAPISGVFNETVFFTLLATLLFVALLKAVLKLYYRRKF